MDHYPNPLERGQTKLVFVHLLDDRSGSPRVLADVAEGLAERGWPVEIWTSAGGDGFLSQSSVQKNSFDYRFHDGKARRLLALLKAELDIFRAMWRYRDQSVVIYVNTLLPFGAAVAGALMGKKVIYHLHEATVRPAALRWALVNVARWTASRAIYVSEFLKKSVPLGERVKAAVVHNALSEPFWEKATEAYFRRSSNAVSDRRKRCVMLCSLKVYKGIWELVRLAERLPSHDFQLVLNADWDEIKAFFKGHELPENLVIFPRQTDVDSFYREADVALNLSRPSGWVESFGMTLLEAMAYGVPAIGPTVGGPTEIIRHGWNGFQVDSADTEALAEAVLRLARPGGSVIWHSENARKTAARHRAEPMLSAIEDAIGEGAPAMRAQSVAMSFC